MQQPSPAEATEPAGAPSYPGGIDAETIYSIIASDRPRYVLHYLKRRGEPVPLDDLAERVAAWENGKEPAAVTSKERKRVYVSLYQSHLPTLHEQGAVEYDRERGVVEVSEAIRNRRIYLEVVPRYDIPWSLYYLGLTLAGAVAIGLAWSRSVRCRTRPSPWRCWSPSAPRRSTRAGRPPVGSSATRARQ